MASLDPNLISHQASVTRELRKQQNGHRSVVLWFTGLSGSGKSTLAYALEEKLYKLGCRSFVLDGDNVRHGLCSDLSFTNADRKENIRRIGEISKLMLESGTIIMSAFISPFRQDREIARKLFLRGDFIEVYCKASLETCEFRDVKGFYKRAKAGIIKNYTGIDSPYEEPIKPELTLDTEKLSVQESINLLVSLIKRGIINKL